MLSDGNHGAPKTQLEILRPEKLRRAIASSTSENNQTRELMSGGKTMNAPPSMLYTDLTRLVHLQSALYHAAEA